MTEEQALETKRNDRPLMVYVYDGEDEDDEARFAAEDDKAFFDEKVVIGARFFDCVRIDAASASSDRALADNVRRLPALVFVRPGFEVEKTLSGRFSAGAIFNAMNATIKQDYDTNVSDVVKRQRALLKERAGLDRDFAKLAQLEERIDQEENTARRGKLVRERDALQKRLDEAVGKIDDAEAALYVVQAKA